MPTKKKETKVKPKKVQPSKLKPKSVKKTTKKGKDKKKEKPKRCPVKPKPKPKPKKKKEEIKEESIDSILEQAIEYRSGLSDFVVRTKSKTIQAILDKKIKKTQKYERLKKLKWGFGIEHEVYMFHVPIYDQKITDFTVFNARQSSIDLIEDRKLNILQKELISKIPLEHSGRKCNGKMILKKLMDGAMPEFVTEYPMSGLEIGKTSVESYCQEIIEKENTFLWLQGLNNYVNKRIKRYGPIMPYPFGMTNYIKKPIQRKDKKVEYAFRKHVNGQEKLHRDYTGSYHLTITLPFSVEKTSEKEFIANHKNFGNQIQWIEPLLISSFFSADDSSLGSSKKRVKGSFRIMRTGWGNLAGSDVRKFDKGVGRYANIKTHWRKGLDFFESEIMKECTKKPAKEPGSIAELSGNMRTFGSRDPTRPWHRESGQGMTKPNGIEIRIFDHFESSHLESLCKFFIYLAENSRTFHTPNYVYEDKDWINATQNIMMHGWLATLTDGYVNKLRKNLNLKIATKSRRAYDVFWQVNLELFEKHKAGIYPYLMLEKIHDRPPILPMVNRYSMENGLSIRLNRKPEILKLFNKFLHLLPLEPFTVNEFSKIFLKILPKKNWKNDVEYVIYYLETIGTLKVEEKDGKIFKIKLNVEYINEINDTNKNILKNWKMDNQMEFDKILKNESNSKSKVIKTIEDFLNQNN